ncbi:MAG TPA: tRNA lysidine(34) synthetase TilS [Phycisphaerae bacterium]|nr:tRNA lysidine(34) synthetase TilS [Phycisphaerae bacterium]
MDTRHFHKIVFDATRRLIPRDSAVVCAVSGGPDSMAMLHGLHRINHLRKTGWTLTVAHLDHHLPPNFSGEMATFVREQAARLHLPFYAESIDVPALSKSTGESIEEAGRKARYAFFARAAASFDAQRVAVAHQANDQAETVLHRILRGTSLRGLAGIPERRPLTPDGDVEIVRPLLSIRREAILAYLARRKLPFLHDVTNDDVSVATRNFIRHDLMPLIERRVNPAAAAALRRIAAHARDASDFLRATAQKLFESALIQNDETGVVLRVASVQGTPPAVLSEVIMLALQQIGTPMKAIRSERLAAVAHSLAPAVEHRVIQLSNGVIAERRGKHLMIRPGFAPREAAVTVAGRAGDQAS